MQTQDKRKSFAFKLAADAKAKTEKKPAWQVRDGVAVAGCTDRTGIGDYRADIDIWGNPRGRDNGYWC